jgi:hypothetical protein
MKLVGAVMTMDRMQRQAIDEGYALRDRETGEFRYKRTGDWQRPPR